MSTTRNGLFELLKGQNGARRGFKIFFGLPSIITISLLMICGALCIGTSEAGNCSLSQTISIRRDDAIFNVTGNKLTIFPLVNGEVVPGLELHWDMDVYVERAQQTHDISGDPLHINYTYVGPTVPFTFNEHNHVDPLEPYIPYRPCTGSLDTPCGVVLSYFRPGELDCYTTHEIAPFHGFSRESVYVHYSSPESPEFKFVAAHHVLDGDYIDRRNNPGVPFVGRYYKDAMKVNYMWENYPWAGSDQIAYWPGPGNNASALEFWCNMSLSIPFGVNSRITRDRFGRNLTFVGLDDAWSLLVDISAVYLSNGIGYAEDFGFLDLPIDFEDGFFFDTQVNGVMKDRLVGHWDILEYDPNFSSLFHGDITPTPSEPAQKVGKLASWAVALIAIGCVIVVVIALVLIISFVPAARAIIHPFRKTTPRPTTARPETQTWNRGSKPQVS